MDRAAEDQARPHEFMRQASDVLEIPLQGTGLISSDLRVGEVVPASNRPGYLIGGIGQNREVHRDLPALSAFPFSSSIRLLASRSDNPSRPTSNRSPAIFSGLSLSFSQMDRMARSCDAVA